MDINLILLSGRLAAAPEFRTLDSGNTLIRYLVTLRTEFPRHRVDVVPVVLWDPPPEVVAERPAPGRWIWVVASAQRRFWPGTEGQRSRVEIVAREVSLSGDPDIEPFIVLPEDSDAEPAEGA